MVLVALDAVEEGLHDFHDCVGGGAIGFLEFDHGEFDDVDGGGRLLRGCGIGESHAGQDNQRYKS